MRLLIDLQGAQGESRLRGIGRYSRELALAMLRAPGGHVAEVLLNTALPHEQLIADLLEVMPRERIVLWTGPRGVALVRDDPATAAAAAVLRAEAIAARQPDMVHLSSVFEGVSDDVVARWPSGLSRPPTVATCYDLIPLIRRADYIDGPWQDTLRPWYMRQLHEFALTDGLLAISESSRNEAIDVIGYPAGRVHNIRAGVSPAFTAPPEDAAADAALRARYGLPEEPVLFVGAGDKRKNEAGLIQAYALLPEALRARHKLVIVGRTDEESLQAQAQQAGLPRDALMLVPFVAEEDLTRVYANCALFVLPSLHEGFGLPAAEAMACGAPTIGSNSSSVPEVIGRADALFDPLDPASIAERMAAVLGDAALRADLRAHGLAHAAGFTWTDSARRAWAALEAIADQVPPRPVRRLARLALSAPLPPQESGIADYTAELVPALARHYDITLVSDRGTTTAERLAHAFPVLTPERFMAQPERFDRVLYQLGNSTFHLAQLTQMMPAVPGAVVLHDVFLANIWNLHLATAGEARGFARLLLRTHGWAALAFDAREGREATLRRYPCSLDAVQGACGLILHSRHARDILAAHFGPAPAGAAIIPHLRHPPLLPARAAARRRLGVPDEALLVCSFGGVARTKLPGHMLEAWREAALGGQARLVFVGEATPESAALFTPELAALGASCTGRVDGEIYNTWLAAADIAVQLRTGSRGESSGAVADCLGAGVALVVNAHGSAAELPADVCLMLPDAPRPAETGAALRTLAHDTALRARLAAAGRAYAVLRLEPDRIAEEYAAAIEAAYGARGLHAAVRAIRADAASQGANAATLGPALAATFPRPGPRTWFVDGAAAVQAGLGEALADWLGGHPDDQRVHLVTSAPDGLRTDAALAAKLLGLTGCDGFGEPAEPQPGDVLLCGEALAAEPMITGLALAGVAVHRVERTLTRGMNPAEDPAIPTI